MQLHLNISGIKLSILFHQLRLFQICRSRYRAFLIKKPGVLKIEIHSPQGRIHGPSELTTIEGRQTLVYFRDGLRLTADKDNLLKWELNVNRLAGVDTALRVLLAQELPRRKAALIHSAAWEWQKKGWLFPGRSGAGKSTLGRLIKKKGILYSDELNIVKKTPWGWRLYSTPFWGAMAGTPIHREVSLKGILFPVKSESWGTRPVQTIAGIKELLKCILNFRIQKTQMDPLLQVAASLIEETTVGQIHFSRSAKGRNTFYTFTQN